MGLEVFLESSGYVSKPILNLSNDSLAVECADDEVAPIIYYEMFTDGEQTYLNKNN